MNREDKIKYYEGLIYNKEVVDKVVRGILKGTVAKVSQRTAPQDLHYLSFVKLSLMIADLHVDIVELDASNHGGGDPVWYSSPEIFSPGECYRIYQQAKPIFEKRYELEREFTRAEAAVKCNRLREDILSKL